MTVRVLSAESLQAADELLDAEESFWNFFFSLIAFVLYLVMGAAIFSAVEDEDFGMMLWMFVVTVSTVGYGDISPSTNAGKWLNSFFIVFNVFVFSYFFSVTFNYVYYTQEKLLSAKSLIKAPSKSAWADKLREIGAALDEALLGDAEALEEHRGKMAGTLLDPQRRVC